MRSVMPVFATGLFTLSAVLGLAAVAPDAAVLQFDPFQPATLLPVIAAGFHEVHTLVRGWLDTALGELRDVLQRTKLQEVLPQ